MSLNNDNVKVVRTNGEAKIKIRKNKLGAVLLVGIFRLLFFILVLRYSYIMITGHSDGQFSNASE